MNFKLNTQQQDAILYAVNYTLANQSELTMSGQTVFNLYDVQGAFIKEENKRYNILSGTHQGVLKARIESMSNRIQELEAHLEILEKQLELYYAE